MSKPYHYFILALIVLVSAVISGFGFHYLLSRLMIKDGVIVVRPRQESPTSPSVLPMGQDGVYIMPTGNKDNPLLPGQGSVGGNTACGRLTNLKKCLEAKHSSLSAQIDPAGITGSEPICGQTLNTLAPIRAQTVDIGCIW